MGKCEAENAIFYYKTSIFPSKLKDFPPKLKDFLPKLKIFFLNSRIRQIHLLVLPKNRWKKKPALKDSAIFKGNSIFNYKCGLQIPEFLKHTCRAKVKLGQNKVKLFQAQQALNEAWMLDQAVNKTLSMVNLDETLVIVTADHGHTMSIAGYQVHMAFFV